MQNNFNEKDFKIMLREPVKRIDFLFGEMWKIALNSAIDYSKSVNELNKKKLAYETLKEPFHELMIKQRDRCKKCSKKCYENTKNVIDVDRYMSKIYDIEALPQLLRRPTAENYLLLHLIYDYTMLFNNFLVQQKLTKKLTAQVTREYYGSLIRFIQNECIKGCSYACIRLHKDNGYCNLCVLIDEALPCPIKKQISYKKVGVEKITRCSRLEESIKNDLIARQIIQKF